MRTASAKGALGTESRGEARTNAPDNAVIEHAFTANRLEIKQVDEPERLVHKIQEHASASRKHARPGKFIEVVTVSRTHKLADPIDVV